MYKKYLHSEFQRAQHFRIYKFVHLHVSAAQNARVAFELHLTDSENKALGSWSRGPVDAAPSLQRPCVWIS